MEWPVVDEYKIIYSIIYKMEHCCTCNGSGSRCDRCTNKSRVKTLNIDDCSLGNGGDIAIGLTSGKSRLIWRCSDNGPSAVAHWLTEKQVYRPMMHVQYFISITSPCWDSGVVTPSFPRWVGYSITQLILPLSKWHEHWTIAPSVVIADYFFIATNELFKHHTKY